MNKKLNSIVFITLFGAVVLAGYFVTRSNSNNSANTIPVSYANTTASNLSATRATDSTASTTKASTLDFTTLQTQIQGLIGDNLNNYTVYLEDLDNGQTLNINLGMIVEPASIAKLPVAVLVMRDVDAGKITLDDTFDFDNSKKFGDVGDLGDLPDGTPVTFRKYLEELLEQSDNNAWYMLVDYLGGSYQSVNPRIMAELGINPLFLDPPEGTAEMVGKVLDEIYNATTLTRSSSDYLISLMENADPWAKEGIGLGLPAGITYANKIGTLDDSGKVSYQDAAIVWGAKTKYILVIMDQNTEWGDGMNMIQNISTMVYNYLN